MGVQTKLCFVGTRTTAIDIAGKTVLQKENISAKCKVDIAALAKNQTYFVRLLDKNNQAIEVKKFFVSQ
jgi:hypothetical protein